MDLLNWKILKCLQTNARQSNTQIGRTVGISSPAVAERIKKMEDAGIISGYHTMVAPLEVGYQLKAIITLRAFMGTVGMTLCHSLWPARRLETTRYACNSRTQVIQASACMILQRPTALQCFGPMIELQSTSFLTLE